MITKRIAAIAAGLALSLGAFSACGLTDDELTDPSMQTLRYEGGDTGGSKFKTCVGEGEKIVSNDKFYSYPTTQREAVWDSDNFKPDDNGDGLPEGSADYPDLQVTDKDGRIVFVKMKISFFLNTNCDEVKVGDKTYKGGVLQVFHEKIGKTRHAYFKDGKYDDGWLFAMNNYIATPATDFVSRAARGSQAETLYNDVDVQTKIQNDLADQMESLVNAGMETDLQFYKDFTVRIYKITPEESYLNLIKEREDAQIKAETAQSNADAQVAQANADAKVAEAQAKIKRNEIAGYGGFENYKCIYLADKGLNCAQPQYLVGGSK